MAHKKITLLLFVSLFILTIGCTNGKCHYPRLFFSDVIQSVVSDYLEKIDTSHNDFNNVHLTAITLYRYNGEDKVCLNSYPMWGGIYIADTAAKKVCAFFTKTNSFVEVFATPDCRHYIINAPIRVSKKKKRLLEKSSYTLQGEIINSWESYCEYTIKQDGTLRFEYGSINGTKMEHDI